jgi:hypothetical protein
MDTQEDYKKIERERKLFYAGLLEDELPEARSVEVDALTREEDERGIRHTIIASIDGAKYTRSASNYHKAVADIARSHRRATAALAQAKRPICLPPVAPDSPSLFDTLASAFMPQVLTHFETVNPFA